MIFWKAISLATCVFFILGCSGSQQPAIVVDKDSAKQTITTKPASSYQDTLFISRTAAIFYAPDSLQLDKIRQVTDPRIFKGSMHEYEFQLRNAHIFLKEHWHGIQVIEARKVRYLCFIREDRSRVVIDLDKEGDAYGMFVFDPGKNPRLVDMTNVENQVPAYFSAQ